MSIFVRGIASVLRICGGFKSANKTWVRKAQIRKLPYLRKARKSNKLGKSANIRICDLRNLFADRPPKLFTVETLLDYGLHRVPLYTRCHK
jgi:hypothetical protein